jgi:DNA-binding LytR/AlgR family response regulator
MSHCPCVDTIMNVSGTYDLIVQCRFDDFAHYTEQIESIRPQISRLASRLDFNFICSRTDRRDEDEDKALWLPCEGGRKRIETRFIDKVLAEGDYMRVHVGDWNCLVHHTMSRLREQLSSPEFLRLRRSCLVRVGFIERLTHEGRRWTARLKDGTHVPVAQASVADVVRLIASESSTLRRTSSNESQPNRKAESSTEFLLKLPS